MLKRNFRLRKSADFNKVYKQGSYSGAKYLYARIRKTRLPVTRAAVVVSKKISKKAVVRNRINRRTTEIIREMWPKLKTGFDIIIITRAEIDALSRQQLQKELETVLKKAKVIEQ